jgi:hypothetical protein
VKRKEILYKEYWIKPVYKTKWAVYKDGGTSAYTFGARCGTVYPDIRISINFNSVQECKSFIDNFLKERE